MKVASIALLLFLCMSCINDKGDCITKYENVPYEVQLSVSGEPYKTGILLIFEMEDVLDTIEFSTTLPWDTSFSHENDLWLYFVSQYLDTALVLTNSLSVNNTKLIEDISWVRSDISWTLIANDYQSPYTDCP